MKARAEAVLTFKCLSRHPGETEDGSHSHHRLRKSAELQIPRGCARLSYLQPRRSRLLPGWGRDPQHPPTPFLALFRRRGDGLHFPRRGPQWPVLGLGLGHRPPGARKLPSLQRGKKKVVEERECSGAETEKRGTVVEADVRGRMRTVSEGGDQV